VVVPDRRVKNDVDTQESNSQEPLFKVAEFGGIDGWNEIVIDEPTRIARNASELAKMDLKWGERAERSCNLQNYTPENARNVKPRDSRKSEREKGAKNGEYNEGAVKKGHKVRERSVNHWKTGGRFRPPNRPALICRPT
jgi:hypothetical protein